MPQKIGLGRAHFVNRKSLHLDDFHPPGERFRTLPGKLRRRAAQNKKRRGISHTIRQNPQNRKQPRHPLRLVNHHQPPQIRKQGHRVLHQPGNNRILQIEKVRVIRWQDLTRQRCFSALARPNQGRNRIPPQCAFKLLTVAGT